MFTLDPEETKKMQYQFRCSFGVGGWVLNTSFVLGNREKGSACIMKVNFSCWDLAISAEGQFFVIASHSRGLNKWQNGSHWC